MLNLHTNCRLHVKFSFEINHTGRKWFMNAPNPLLKRRIRGKKRGRLVNIEMYPIDCTYTEWLLVILVKTTMTVLNPARHTQNVQSQGVIGCCYTQADLIRTPFYHRWSNQMYIGHHPIETHKSHVCNVNLNVKLDAPNDDIRAKFRRFPTLLVMLTLRYIC